MKLNKEFKDFYDWLKEEYNKIVLLVKSDTEYYKWYISSVDTCNALFNKIKSRINKTKEYNKLNVDDIICNFIELSDSIKDEYNFLRTDINDYQSLNIKFSWFKVSLDYFNSFISTINEDGGIYGRISC